MTASDAEPLFHKIASNLLDSYCARRARSSPVIVAWPKIKESRLKLPRDAVSTYLYVVSTMGVRGDSMNVGGGGLGSSFCP